MGVKFQLSVMGSESADKGSLREGTANNRSQGEKSVEGKPEGSPEDKPEGRPPEEIIIKGKYFKSLEETGRALCLCHGIPGEKASREGKRSEETAEGKEGETPLAPGAGGYEHLAHKFSRAGFFTLTFNFRGTGESGGNFDLLDWTLDLGAVIDYLAGFPEIREINLMGFSGGAATALYHTARDQRINSLILAACPADIGFLINRDNLEETIGRLRNIGIIRDPGFPRNPLEWMNRALSLRPQENIPRVSPRPVLILHGTKDELIPPEHAHGLYRAAREPRKLHLVEGAGHRLRQYDRITDLAVDWLKAVDWLN